MSDTNEARMDPKEREQRLNDVREIVVIQLKRKQPTHTDVQKKVRSCLEDELPDYTQEELNRIVSEIEYSIRITVQEPDILVDKSSQTNWFKIAEPNTPTRYFDRYKRYLRGEGFPEVVIEQMEKDTRRILSLSANPMSHADKKRGLVVGDVQSGKTANYLSLINLACDFGYKIIVLLAGMTDSLREQTQDRVDLGFIGAMSDTIGGGVEYVGVGEDKNEVFAVPLTNSRKDFVKFIKSNLNATPTEFSKPLVLVVKKNKGVLSHVCDWLKTKKEIQYQNILIVDDEADNASVNSSRDEDSPTQINLKIRELYAGFNVATYVGFTATPFANIFINPDDDVNLKNLFPSDYIVQLKTPSSYCGVHWFFDKDSTNSHLRVIDESETGFLPAVHRQYDDYNGPSESLKESILVFLLGCAVRSLRGQEGKHRSMMINISRFNPLQWKIHFAVNAFVEELRDVVTQEAYKDLDEYIKHPLLKKLHDLYTQMPMFAKAREEIAFVSLKGIMRCEIKRFEVVVMNNKVLPEKRFSYKQHPNGARVIAIGGFLLSRGLTLEGLMVSYYSRNTSTYDSLLQMGRWFGYRFGYDDLCVLYISRINIANFKAVSLAVDDLKEQFSEMKAKGLPPSEFGLMVRESPDALETVLLVTSRNKMYHSQAIEYWISYGGTVADTSKLYKSRAKNQDNESLCQQFVKTLQEMGLDFEKIGSRHVISHVPKKMVARFIGDLAIHFENRKFDTETLSAYIEESKIFPEWDVVVATGAHDTMKWSIGGLDFPAAIRVCDIRDEEDFIRVGQNNNRLLEPGIFSAGLTEEELTALRSNAKKDLTYTDYLNVKGRRPLLVFYPLALSKAGEAINKEPYIGFAVGFPSRGRKDKATYRANDVKIKELMKTIDILDEDEKGESL